MIRPVGKSIRILIAICLMVSNTPSALSQGQTNGAIQGRAYEVGTNAPVVGVVITVTNQDNGLERSTVTRADGIYTITTLPPGLYRMTATGNGYESDPIENFPVRLGKTNQVQPPPFAMRKINAPTPTPTPQPAQPVPVQQTPTQTASTRTESADEQLTNTVNATRSDNFDMRQLVGLPLPGTRSFDDLAFLAPGVAPPPEAVGLRVGPGIGPGVGSSGQFSVNGARARSNNFTVDGSDNNDPDVGVRRQGFVALVPQSVESVQEFRISTLLWDAEFGRNLGAQVDAVSKGGGREYHGQAYGFFTDSSLNARNFFTPSGRKDPYTRSLAGFVLGGPLGNKGTQFFLSFEHDDLNASVTQHFASPTLQERRFLNAPGLFTVNNPATGLSSFTTGNGSTPVGSSVFSFYPVPNNLDGPYGANTFTRVLPASGDGTIGSFRVTQQVTPESTLNARYNLTDDSRILPSINRAINSSIEADTRTQNLSFFFDSGLSATVFNQARLSYGRTSLSFPPLPSTPTCLINGKQIPFCSEVTSSITIPVIFPDGTRENRVFTVGTGPVGQLIIQPFSPVGVDVLTFPQSRTNNTFQFADTISWTLRKHSLKFGADIRRVQLNSQQDRNYRPLVVFNPGILRTGFSNDDGFNITGVSLLNATDIASLGQSSAIYQTVTSGVPNSTIGLRSTEFDVFVNDNWRIRPNFTLDYGLRYEYNTTPREVNHRIVDALTLGNLPTPGNSPFNTKENLDAFNATLDAYKQVVGGRGSIYDPDGNNFGPHIGFAWDPGSDGKTSIRAGYGIYYDTILGAVVSQSRNVFPNEIPLTLDAVTFGANVFSLRNPAFFRFIQTRGGELLAEAPFIAPGTLNQFGGSPGDFNALLGFLFRISRVDFGDGTTTRSGLAFTLPEKNLRTPYAQQWHLSIERQIFGDYLISAAYAGTKGTKLTRLTTPNKGPNLTPFIEVEDADQQNLVVSGRGQFRLPRPEFNLGAYQIFENSANSNYHALQLEARKRYSHGYNFTLAYTWSHAIDYVSDVLPIAGAPILPQDSFNFRAERGDANYDVRHIFTASVVWDLPIYRDSTSAAARWLGGWQIASIFQAHTGQPFTLNLPIDANLDGNLSDRPATTNGLTFLDSHGPRRVSLASGKGVLDFLGSGNRTVGRNTVRADDFFNLNMALNKAFRFTESQRLEFRTEFFNLFNRANFGIPIRIIGAPGFGSSVDTVNPARTIQLAIKYSF